jgi:hypothetical protein
MKHALPTLLALVLMITGSLAAEPWPAETWQQSINLTELDDGSLGFAKDVSGAFFNTATGELWVADNGGQFVLLVPDGEGSYVVAYQNDSHAYWQPPGGLDMEGITQVDLQENSVYVMAERQHKIVKFDTSRFGVVNQLAQWDIRSFVPAYDGRGPEGITFVPDEWLSKSGFTRPDGTAFPASANGMGGLMLVAHQNGGRVYAFDLGAAGKVDLVGVYSTNAGESSGLDFNRKSGKLLVWHNTGGNTLEEVSLKSTNGTFDSLRTWASPKGGNLECIAVNGRLLVLCDDSNANGYALMLYKEWNVDVQTIDVPVSAGRDDAEERFGGRMSLGSSDLELVQDGGTHQTVGLRFRNTPIPPGATIIRAYIQFSMGEPDKPAKLTIHSEDSPFATGFGRTKYDITNRTMHPTSVAWEPKTWHTIAPPEDLRTPDLTERVQAIVSTPGWKSGNAMAFVVTGEKGSKRLAVSVNGDRKHAPVLHVEFVE